MTTALCATGIDVGHDCQHVYLTLRNAEKPAKVALIAVARKIVVAAYAIVKSGTGWQNQLDQQ